MVTVEIKALTDKPTAEVVEFLEGIKESFKLKLYVELWDRPPFMAYFKNARPKLNPVTGHFMDPRGFYHRLEREHQLCIILEDGWENAMIHELTHALQSEIMGAPAWQMFSDIYHTDDDTLRGLDPFEVQAYLAEEKGGLPPWNSKRGGD